MSSSEVRNPTTTTRRDRVRFDAIALALYALVAFVFTFPLALHLTTHIPDGHDDVYAFLWNNSWIYDALTRFHTSPLRTDRIFEPFGADLRLHTLGPLYGILSIPFYAWLGQVGVLNTQILLTIVANGFAGYRLVTRVAGNRQAGLFAGLLLAATPAIEFHLAVGRPSCAGLWPALLALSAFLGLLERPRLSTAISLSVWLVASMLVDQIATFFCGLWLLALLAHACIARGRAVLNAQLVIALGVVAVLTIGPAYVLYWQPFVQLKDYTVPGAIEAYTYSYPVQLLWTPTMVWRVYGTVMPLALVMSLALWRRATLARLWAIVAAAFVVLSFGPVAMRTSVPLPFALLRALPLFDQFRTPF